VPPGQTELAVAALPPSLATELPASLDLPTITVTLIDYEGVDGYDALRALPEWQLTTLSVPDDPLPLMSGDRTAGPTTTVAVWTAPPHGSRCSARAVTTACRRCPMHRRAW